MVLIGPGTYYTVQGWMISELGLKGNALQVYAIIYGFSQDGTSEYTGSARYLCWWLGCSKKTVLNVLADLTERGLLIKNTVNKNGVIFNNYRAARAVNPNAPQREPDGKEKPPVHKYGEYKNVELTDEELASLQELYPADFSDRIERLSAYIKSSGKRYASHYATIRNWAARDAEKGQQQGGKTGPNGIPIDPNQPDDLPW